MNLLADIIDHSPAGLVISELAPRLEVLAPVMVVGAEARDALHRAAGFTFPYVASSDIDVVVVCTSWSDYTQLTRGLRPTGSTGYRFTVAGHPVDIIPFGDLEQPAGTLSRPGRTDTFDVFGMQSVYGSSSEIELSSGILCRIPTAAGYAALKLKAWVDRSSWFEYKDAYDVALALYWFMNNSTVIEALWTERVDELEAFGFDLGRALAADLGAAITQILGADLSLQLKELLTDESLTELSRRMIPKSVPAMRELIDPDRCFRLLVDMRAAL